MHDTTHPMKQTRRRPRAALLQTAAVTLLALCASACQPRQQNVTGDGPEMSAFVELMMPKAIEIQHYLTRPRDFSGDGSADGVEVVLVARDSFGDSVKCVGTFHFELYTMRLASGDKLGERVAFWPVTINSDKRMVQYWDRVTRSYLFKLQLSDGRLAPGRYVLTAQLITPAGSKLYDTYEFAYKTGQ